MRLEVMPPWEWPASQKALMVSRPNCSNTRSVIACRWASSSAACHMRMAGAPGKIEAVLAAVGVAITRRYFSLKSKAGK